MKKNNLDENLKKIILKEIRKCFSCSKCSAGCPLADRMDFPPAVLVKMIACGKLDKLLSSRTIWLCSSCYTCLSRCPFEINIPHIIDLLKEFTLKNKLPGKEKGIQAFHKIFLEELKSKGRIHEISFIKRWKLSSGNLFKDIFLGLRMFLKGKLPIKGEKIKGAKELRRLLDEDTI